MTECPNYEISDCGRVRNINTQMIHGINTRPNGSRFAVLRRTACDQVTINIAPLVCTAYHGPRPSPDHISVHLNGNRGDDRAINLKWMTRSDSLRMQYRTGQRSSPGTTRRMTQQQHMRIWAMWDEGASMSAIARDVGCTCSAISKIVRGQLANLVLGRESSDDHSPITQQQQQLEDQLLTLLREQPVISMREMVARLGRSEGRIRTTITRLMAAGRLRRCPQPPLPTRYTVV